MAPFFSVLSSKYHLTVQRVDLTASANKASVLLIFTTHSQMHILHW